MGGKEFDSLNQIISSKRDRSAAHFGTLTSHPPSNPTRHLARVRHLVGGGARGHLRLTRGTCARHHDTVPCVANLS